MEKKEGMKNITIKFTIGIVIIAIISQAINIFALGLDIFMKAEETITGETNHISIIVSILIQLLSFIIMYYIMNKIVLKNTVVKKEDIVKIIRNIVIVSMIAVLTNMIIVGNAELIGLKNLVINMIAIILIIPIERKMLNNRSDIDEETKRKQNKVMICYIMVITLIIFVAIGIICMKTISEDNEQIIMSLFLVRDIDGIQKSNIEQSLRNSKYVESYEYISEEEAEEQMSEKLENLSIEYTNLIPFPAKFEIKVRSKNIDKIKEIYEQMEGIRKISF